MRPYSAWAATPKVLSYATGVPAIYRYCPGVVIVAVVQAAWAGLARLADRTVP